MDRHNNKRKMVGFDKIQFLTFAMGVIVLTCTILSYQNTTYNRTLRKLVDILQSGLGFLFVAYAALLKAEASSKEYKTYKMFILAVTLTSWIVWIFLGKLVVTQDIGDSSVRNVPVDEDAQGGWDNVALMVARPLALGSMFVLPYLYL